MIGERLVMQESLLYAFPPDHLLPRIDRFVDCSELRQHLAGFYSTTGRPSTDSELMIRMLLIGYCLGIRSERRLCEEVHLNLAYSWFCRLGLEGKVPDHSTFSENRHGRFRECDLFRHLFGTVVQRCIDEALVGGEGFAVDASLIQADDNKQRSLPAADWVAQDHPATASLKASGLRPDSSLSLPCLAMYRRSPRN
jgi:transposase